MKRRRDESPPPAAADAESVSIQPLETARFARDWPSWKQDFETRLLTLCPAPVSEKCKIAVFMKAIGRKVERLVNLLMPELQLKPALNIPLSEILAKCDDYSKSSQILKYRKVEALHKICKTNYEKNVQAELQSSDLQNIYEELSAALLLINIDSIYKEKLQWDYLLASIPDKRNAAAEQSAGTILTNYNRLGDVNLILKNVLPFLCLDDLAALGSTSPHLKLIIRKYITFGGMVTLDTCCWTTEQAREYILQKLPEVKFLCVKGAAGESFQSILNAGVNLEKLSLIRIHSMEEQLERNPHKKLKELRAFDLTVPDSLII